MAERTASANATRTIIILVGAGLMIFTLPTVLILVVGMLPTSVAYFIDRRREKYTTLCVGSMNFVGVIPFLAALWQEEHSFDMAFQILADPLGWLMMLGAAGIGWAIYFVAPSIVSMVMAARIEQRIEQLENRQNELVEEWGPSVAGNEEGDKGGG